MQCSIDRVTFQLLKSILVPLSFEWLNLTFAVYVLRVLIIDNVKHLEKALSSVEGNEKYRHRKRSQSDPFLYHCPIKGNWWGSERYFIYIWPMFLGSIMKNYLLSVSGGVEAIQKK